MVENYSYFQCPNCGEKHYIFGKSNLEQVAKDLDVKVLAQIPMDPAMATAMDPGRPWKAWKRTTWSRWQTPSWPTRRAEAHRQQRPTE